MGVLGSIKGVLNLGGKITFEELNKEKIRLSLEEENLIMDIRNLRAKWKKLYEEGKHKDKYEKRALLRIMRRIEEKIAENDLKLSKIDVAIRAVDKTISVMERAKSIFKGDFWNKVEKILTSDKLIDIIVEENFREREVLRRLAEIANIQDKHVLEVIDGIEDEEIEAVWGKEVDVSELDNILDKKIEERKKKLEIEEL